MIEVGEWELNRNPDNYFAEVEQAAFNPANVPPGIGFSPDKMLQGRLFSYGDAQRRGWIDETDRHRKLLARLDTLIAQAAR